MYGKEKSYTKEDLAQAIQDVLSGDKSQRQACLDWGVPQGTLQGRLNGSTERQEAHEMQQLLSSAEEAALVQWCLEMQHCFLPVRYVHILGQAEAIIWNRTGQSNVHIGKHWIPRFIECHPELKVTTSKRIDEKQVMAKNPVYVMEFYVHLSNTLRHYSIDSSCIFNLDEKGFLMGLLGQEKVVILTQDHWDGYAGGSKDYGNRETITTIDTICADGSVLPPMIIMKGKNVQRAWRNGSPLPKSTRWACSPNGWTDNELGVAYIKAFDEWTAEKALDGKWRCLILNGHGSHLTHKFLQYTFDACIIVIGLPSHTTEFLQPLDWGIFQALQHFYGQAVDNHMQKMLRVNKSNFSFLLHKARAQAYTEQNILLAFEATGISLFDPYQTPVMREFCDLMRGQEQVSSQVPKVVPDCIDITQSIRELLHNKEDCPQAMREALSNAIKLIDSSKARATIVEADLRQLCESLQEKTQKKPRNGQVGRAQVYKQEEINKICEREEACARTSASKGKRRTTNEQPHKNIIKTQRQKKGTRKTPSHIQKSSESEFEPESEDTG